jgi:hypothetical protein
VIVRNLAKPVNEHVVADLRLLLQQAEAGDVIGLVFVALRPGRLSTIGRVGDINEADEALAIHDLGHSLARTRAARAGLDQ